MSQRPGFRAALILALGTLTALALSCAGPNKLAQQSEQAYSKGEVEKAYQKAARALRKEPENRRARAAMTQAAAQLMREREAEIRGIAARDTVAAAKRSLTLDDFRNEILVYRVVLPPDPDFDRDEAQIRLSAAGITYRNARADLQDGSPKHAYDGFQLTHTFEPHYLDVSRRMQEAYDEALPRVALLPFANETDLGSLSKEFSDRAYNELARRTESPDFRFTDLLSRERVYQAVPISLLDHLGRRVAARIGHEIGADRVIVGRFYGMRSSTNTGNFTQPVYRKIEDMDEQGKTRERYVEKTIEVLSRDREVSVDFEYEIVDVQNGSAILGNSGTIRAAAHAIFTSGPVDGEEGEYCLIPPDMEKADPKRAERVAADWGNRCGDWKLADLIRRSRSERSRAYESRYQDDWSLWANNRAVFLGDVPSEGDLVRLAYCQVFEPLTRTLRELDGSEPRTVLERGSR